MYAVVLFIEHDEVEVVPLSWVRQNKCSWPSKGCNIGRLIEQRAPAEPEWVTYETRILDTTESYEKARKKCKKAVILNTSDLATTDDARKRKSKPSSKFDSSDNGTGDESDGAPSQKRTNRTKKSTKFTSPPPPLPPLPDVPDVFVSSTKGSSGDKTPSTHTLVTASVKTPRSQGSKGPSGATNIMHDVSSLSCSSGAQEFSVVNTTPRSIILTTSRDPVSTPSRLAPRRIDGDEVPSTSTEREMKLFQTLEEIKGQVRKNTLLLQSIINKQSLETLQDTSVEDFDLPLETEADIERMEELLRDKGREKKLVVSMRPLVKKCKVDIIHKLTRQIHKLRKKKGSETQVAANNKKADRLREEIDVMKILPLDRVAKNALANTDSLELLGQKPDAENRVLLRVACHAKMADKVTEWRKKHDDWKSLAAFMLYKNTGRRYKKKKQPKTEEDHTTDQTTETKDDDQTKDDEKNEVSDTAEDNGLDSDKTNRTVMVKNQKIEKQGIISKQDISGKFSTEQTEHRKVNSGLTKKQSDSENSDESDSSAESIEDESSGLSSTEKKKSTQTSELVKSIKVKSITTEKPSDSSSEDNDNESESLSETETSKNPVVKFQDDCPTDMVVQKLDLGKLTEQDLANHQDETDISFLLRNKNNQKGRTKSKGTRTCQSETLETKPQKKKRDSFFWNSDSSSGPESDSQDDDNESGVESDDSGRGSGTHRPVESLFIGSLTNPNKVRITQAKPKSINPGKQTGRYSKSTNPNSGRGGLFIKQQQKPKTRPDRVQGRSTGKETSFNKKRPASDSGDKLHPSWEASKRRREQQNTLQAFAGKKTTFDDDD